MAQIEQLTILKTVQKSLGCAEEKKALEKEMRSPFGCCSFTFERLPQCLQHSKLNSLPQNISKYRLVCDYAS
jgi:hypothetical protein